MNWKAFKKGFLNAFDPFASAPKRVDAFNEKQEKSIIEAEYQVVNSAETMIHQAFTRALTDVKQAG